MKLSASILIGLLASYLALMFAAGHLEALSSAACSQDFTLPGIACRIGGGLVTLLLAPATGLLAFLAAYRALGKRR